MAGKGDTPRPIKDYQDYLKRRENIDWSKKGVESFDPENCQLDEKVPSLIIRDYVEEWKGSK